MRNCNSFCFCLSNVLLLFAVLRDNILRFFFNSIISFSGSLLHQTVQTETCRLLVFLFHWILNAIDCGSLLFQNKEGFKSFIFSEVVLEVPCRKQSSQRFYICARN